MASFKKTDEVRKHVIANRAAYPKADEILGLYREQETSSQAIATDTRAYLAALADPAIGIKQPTRAGEPIVLASLRYDNELDLALAAGELGIEPEVLQEKLGNISDATLSRRVGSLRSKGGVVKRETFIDAFGQLTSVLKLGQAFTVVAKPVIAKKAIPNQPPVEPVAPPIDLLTLRFGNDQRTAANALANAQRTMRTTKWREAGPLFEIAIRQATTPLFRLRACEEAIAFYQRTQSVEPLLSAYQFILHSCRTGFEVKQTRDRLFTALGQIASGDDSWISNVRSPRPIRWPLSMTRAIAARFEAPLAKVPNHEPSLRVLEKLYSTIQADPKKQMIVLQRLEMILRTRGEHLEQDSGVTLANLLVKSGKALLGAELLGNYAQSAFGAESAKLYQMEADAWVEAGSRTKAMTAMRKTLIQWKAAGSYDKGNAFVRMGDTYMKLKERARAADLYRSALVAQASGYRVEELQQKLSEALGEKAPSEEIAAAKALQAAIEPMSSELVKSLLDPSRKYRLEAEAAEKSANRSPAMMASYMMNAAESWIKAGDKERAVSAIKKAAIANARGDASSAKYNYAKIAQLFRDADQNQLALEQWVLALKANSSTSAIRGIQNQIVVMVQEDPTLKVDAKLQPMLDVNYVLRVQAKEAEKKRANDSYIRASYLLRAAGFWLQASDNSDAKRCLTAAESVAASLPTDPKDPQKASLHGQIADAFGKLEMPEEEVRNLMAAIRHSTADFTAQRLYKRVKVICQNHGLTEPQMDAASAKKLDPLNRYRVQAADYEAQVKANPSSASTYYGMAVRAWQRADEIENAIRVADAWASLVVKDKTSRGYERDCGAIGDIYVKLDRKDDARRMYEEQLKVAEHDYKKKSIQRKLDQLSVSAP